MESSDIALSFDGKKRVEGEGLLIFTTFLSDAGFILGAHAIMGSCACVFLIHCTILHNTWFGA